MRKGFTLIELLIVVAIIAILAAIAVPNFLEAQTRAKVARVHADLRTIATALESFFTDRNCYPPCGFWQHPVYGGPGAMPWVDGKFEPWIDPADANFWLINDVFYLTTPIAYLTKIPVDTFSAPNTWYEGRMVYVNHQNRRKYAKYHGAVYAVPVIGTVVDPEWSIHSIGPDLVRNADLVQAVPPKLPPGDDYLFYDTSNGTTSIGDIFRTGPQ